MKRGKVLKRDLDPLDWQERHSPTEDYSVRISGERSMVLTRRRKQDARLFDKLTNDHIKAMEEINCAYWYIAGEAGYRFMRYSAEVGGRIPLHGELEKMREAYKEWIDRGARGAFKIKPALSIIIEAKSYTITASSFNKRRSWVKGNFHDSLMTYCEIRGWPKKINR